MALSERRRIEDRLEELDIAVVIKSFDRPEFLEDCVGSLEKCEDKEQLDWFFFQDGAHNPYSNKDRTQEYFIDECEDIIRGADIPLTDIRRNDKNRGAAIQCLDAFSMVEEGYDMVISMDGDILISKWFPRVAASLAEQYPDDFISLYSQGPVKKTVTTSSLKKAERGLHMGTDRDGNHHVNLPATVVTRSLYDDIEHGLEELREIAEGHDWWPGWRPSKKLELEYGSNVTNAVDGALVTILSINNKNAVQPAISRASHIGVYGMNVTEDSYDERFGDEGKLDYEWDREPGEWDPV